MPHTDLPYAVAAFIDAAKCRAPHRLLASFNYDAVVFDHGRQYRGTAIRDWNNRHFLTTGITIRLLDAVMQDDDAVLAVAFDTATDSTGRHYTAERVLRFSLKYDRIATLAMLDGPAWDEMPLSPLLEQEGTDLVDEPMR